MRIPGRIAYRSIRSDDVRATVHAICIIECCKIDGGHSIPVQATRLQVLVV